MYALWITLSETGTGKSFGRFLVAVIVNRQQCERSDRGGRKSLEKTGDRAADTLTRSQWKHGGGPPSYGLPPRIEPGLG